MVEESAHGRTYVDILSALYTLITGLQLPPTFRHFLLDSLQRYSIRTFLSSPGAHTDSPREYKTFSNTFEQAFRLSAWMRKRGLGKDSKVAIGGGNCTGWIMLYCPSS